MQTYKQLTYAQQCQIYALKKTNITQKNIAHNWRQSICGKPRAKRNTGKRGYRFK